MKIRGFAVKLALACAWIFAGAFLFLVNSFAQCGASVEWYNFYPDNYVSSKYQYAGVAWGTFVNINGCSNTELVADIDGVEIYNGSFNSAYLTLCPPLELQKDRIPL